MAGRMRMNDFDNNMRGAYASCVPRWSSRLIAAILFAAATASASVHSIAAARALCPSPTARAEPGTGPEASLAKLLEAGDRLDNPDVRSDDDSGASIAMDTIFAIVGAPGYDTDDAI